MAKKYRKQILNKKKRDDTATVVGEIFTVTPDYVRKVNNGERENEKIIEACVLYQQGKSELINQIKELVPFN